MTTNPRVPIRRPMQRHITPRAVEMYRALQAGETTDEAGDDLDLALHHELGLKPWHLFLRWVRDEQDCHNEFSREVLALRRALDRAVSSQPKQAARR